MDAGAGKTQTFHSDIEDVSYSGGGTVPLIGGAVGGQQQQALPPIHMPTKKGGKKKVVGGGVHHPHHNMMGSTNIAAFNATKKQFPQLNKASATTGSTTQHKKNSYVSPYSIKTISKP